MTANIAEYFKTVSCGSLAMKLELGSHWAVPLARSRSSRSLFGRIFSGRCDVLSDSAAGQYNFS